MCDHHQRGPGLCHQIEHFGHHHIGGVLIEIACGLVGQDKFRPRGQGPCNGDALLLTTGEMFGVFVQMIRQSQGCREAFGALGVVAPREARVEGNIGGHTQ